MKVSTSTLLFGLLLLCSLSSYVESIAWLNGVNGTWGDPQFWVGGVIPEDSGANSVDIIAIGSYSVNIISPSTFAGDITLGDVLHTSNPRLVISSGVSFIVNGNIRILSGTIVVQTGATLTIGGLTIDSTTPTSVFIDYLATLAVTTSIQISNSDFTFTGYGTLNAYSTTTSATTTIIIGSGRQLLFDHATFTIAESTTMQVSPSATIIMNGPLVSVAQRNMDLNANFVFKLGATITGTIAFLTPVVIDPSTDNTIIVNGEIHCTMNVTIVSGSITLQTGKFSVAQGLYMNPSTLFNSNAPAFINLPTGSFIYAYGTANIYSNIDIVNGASFTTPESIIIIGNIKLVEGNLNIKGGSLILSGDLLNLGSGQIIIPTRGASMLTVNPGGRVILDGSSSTQISGAGYLVFLKGSFLVGKKSTTIVNPTIVQATVEVYSATVLTFASPITIYNATTFVGVNGNDGIVVFRGSTDIDNSGDLFDGEKVQVIGVNVLISSGCSVYIVGGKIELGNNGNIWVNGSLYSTMRENYVTGSGSINIYENGVFWVGTRTHISSTLNVKGTLKLNSGWLKISNGTCTGTLSFYGDLVIDGNFDTMDCNPSGNGTLQFNASVPTTHILRPKNYTIPAMVIGGMSTVTTSASGFNLNGNLIINGVGASLLVISNSQVRGNSTIINGGTLGIVGINTMMRSNNIIIDSSSSLAIVADATGSSQVTSTQNTKFDGKLVVGISTGTPSLNEITVANYNSYDGAFNTITVVQDNQNLYYKARYDNKKMVIIPDPNGNPTSSSSGNPNNNGGSTGLNNNDESNASFMVYSSLLVLFSLLLLF